MDQREESSWEFPCDGDLLNVEICYTAKARRIFQNPGRGIPFQLELLDQKPRNHTVSVMQSRIIILLSVNMIRQCFKHFFLIVNNVLTTKWKPILVLYEGIILHENQSSLTAASSFGGHNIELLKETVDVCRYILNQSLCGPFLSYNHRMGPLDLSPWCLSPNYIYENWDIGIAIAMASSHADPLLG